jgi:protoporphyrinogen oxidase
MTGIAAALELAKSGQFDVTVFEKADHLGGMSDYFTWNGITWDRFYHVILSTDAEMLDFISDIGLEDQLFWRETKSGFYGDGKLVSMSTTMDFLKFPFLSLWQKFRLGVGILYSSRINDPSKLDKIYGPQWLTKVFGRRVYEKIWDPLLRSKLGDAREKTSAAFIWATIKRLYGARNAENKQEKMGHVHGGYKTILDAAEIKLKQLGVKVLLNSPITKIESIPERNEISLPNAQRLKPDADSASILNRPQGIPPTSNLQRDEVSLPNAQRLKPDADSASNLQPQTAKLISTNQTNKTNETKKSLRLVASDQDFFFNKALLTVNCPATLNVLDQSKDHSYWDKLKNVQYLGMICCLLILRRRLSPYYVINLLDKELPFTGIIEATNIVSADELDENHLVYLPKYLPADDRLNSMTDAEITSQFVQGLKKVYPKLKDDEVLHSAIYREKFVQPLQELYYLDRTAGIQTPEPNVFTVNTSMIYNSTLNNNAAINLARKAVKTILKKL